MNTKKNKNKNRAKNPAPTQVGEHLEGKPDEVKKCDEKAEERVPEIVSDVVPDVKQEGDNDGPKKPKRNRGKKKKQEPIIDDIVDEDKDDGKEEIDTDDTPFAPVSRKKKGKHQESQLPADKKSDSVKIEELCSEVIKVENDDTKPEVETAISTEKDSEPKSKKKNKKSKKTSEPIHSEEKLSCTLAFQKIQEPKQVKAVVESPTELFTSDSSFSEPTVKENTTKDKIEIKKIENEQKIIDPSIIEPEKTKCPINKHAQDKTKKQDSKKQDETKKIQENLLAESMIQELSEPEIKIDSKVEEKDQIVPKLQEEEKRDDRTNMQENKKNKKGKREPPKLNKDKHDITSHCKDLEIAQITEIPSTINPELEIQSIKNIEKIQEPIPLPFREEVIVGQQSALEKNDSKITPGAIEMIPTSTTTIVDDPIKESKPFDSKKSKGKAKIVKPVEKKDKDQIDQTSEVPTKDDTQSTKESAIVESTNLKNKEENVLGECNIKKSILEEKNTKPKNIFMPFEPVDKVGIIKDETKLESDNKGTDKKEIIKDIIDLEMVKHEKYEPIELTPIITEQAIFPSEIKKETVQSQVDIKNQSEESESVANKKIPTVVKPETKINIFKDIKVTEPVVMGQSIISQDTQQYEMIESIIAEMQKSDEAHKSQSKKKGKKSPKVDKMQEKETLPDLAKNKSQENLSELQQQKTPEKKEFVESKTSEIIIKQIPEENAEKNTEIIKPTSIETFDDDDDIIMTPLTDDIVPDSVEHLQSISERFDDNNNNNNISTIIQEIENKPNLEVISDIPDTSFITGSQVLVDAIKVPKIRAKSQEKNDLKSKVMEVNKDMEDLRLSIERSLAGLTSIEQSEQSMKHAIDSISLDSNKDTAHEEKPSIISSESITEGDLLKGLIMCELIPKDPIPEIFEGLITLKDQKISSTEVKLQETDSSTNTCKDSPTPPSRKDNKKNKSRKKGKQDTAQQTSSTMVSIADQKSTSEQSEKSKESDSKKEEKKPSETDSKSGQKDADSSEPTPKSEENSKKQTNEETLGISDTYPNYEIVQDSENQDKDEEENKDLKETNPIQPKNLLGHPDIPASSNKTDYKKEKNKTPNTKTAKVKIKDSEQVELLSTETQTEGKRKLKNENELQCFTDDNEEYIYKYSFRKVYLSSVCHFCKKEMKSKIPCSQCNLVFYCSQKHREENLNEHQQLCLAVCSIMQLKGYKHIYENASGLIGHNYRLLRMQTILSCESILNRKLSPWEQETLLYPRMCADPKCREWRQDLLVDCDGCGQIAYCASKPDHLPKTHSRWCKSYSLYQRLIVHQLTKGRLEPKLPTKVMTTSKLCDSMNRLLAEMFDEIIDMKEMEYAALTQIATAPLTAAYSYQMYKTKMDSVKNGLIQEPTFTVHVIGAELQFEADCLNKWELFLLHMKPDIQELQVVLIGTELNPSNLPLDLLGRVKLCPTCRVDKRKVKFIFQENIQYHAYCKSDDYVPPDIICAFNPSIYRSIHANILDWDKILHSIEKTRSPFLVTSHTMSELQKDLSSIEKHVNFNLISEPKFNPFASVRPDRNFINDDEIPLLFKNYCYMVLIGAF